MRRARFATDLGGLPAAGLLAVLGTLMIAGCAEELGPVARRTSRVHGRVHLGGAPLEGGWVEFTPVDGTVGDLRSAAIGADGRFEAAGVAVGLNLVRLAHPRTPAGAGALDPNAYWLFQQSFSPIRREVQGPSDEIDLDLLQEASKPETSNLLAKLGHAPR